MFAKIFIATAISALPLQAAIILVDVGGSSAQTTDTGWNNLYWNATTGVNAPVALTNMVDSTGTATTFNLAVTTKGFIGVVGDAKPIVGTPANATVDSFYGLENRSILTLSNLSQSQAYSFKFYSAVDREDVTNRTTRFTINGQFVEINSTNNNGVWTNVLQNIAPDASGNIVIDVGRGTGSSSSYLLNIIHIETAPIPEPGTAALAGLSLLPLLRRKRK